MSVTVEVLSQDSFRVGSAQFKIARTDYHSHKTTDDEIVILKDPVFLSKYTSILKSLPCQNMLEFGIFEGGSAIFFALANPDLKVVGIDLRNPNEAVLRQIQRLGLSDRVKLYYGTSQADENAVSTIIEREFGKAGVGLIVDDASHMYDLSKRSFEITFGRMQKGGSYCIEDWAWAHWVSHQTGSWADKPALSNLIFELTMLLPSANPLIEQIRINTGFVQLVRGTLPAGKIRIDDLIKSRGRKLAQI